MDKDRIVILGPMDCECDLLVSRLEDKKILNIAGYVFYEGRLCGLPVAVCRCLMGNSNAAVCTAFAIKQYNPRFVILQGTSGAHIIEAEPGDIAVAEKIVHISNYISKCRLPGEGIHPEEWEDFGIETYSEKTGKTECLTEFYCDEALLDIARKVDYSGGTVRFGTVGCADVWNREADMINRIHTVKGTLCEAMEGVGTAQACAAFGVPLIEIRVISNNELKKGKQFDEKTAQCSQRFVCDFLKILAHG